VSLKAVFRKSKPFGSAIPKLTAMGNISAGPAAATRTFAGTAMGNQGHAHFCGNTVMSDEIKFYKVTDPYGCFSNFSPHPVYIGRTWQTAEHYFQAQKFLDAGLRMKILMAKLPMIAARMGRNRARPLRHDWEKVKDGVMRTAVRSKIRQHADVRETLLSTGNATIIEHTENDSYWGDGGDGSGKNMLGKIFMEVRAELTKDGPFDELAGAPPPPWIEYPGSERFWGGWRQGNAEPYFIEWKVWYGGLSDGGKLKYQQIYPEPEEWRGFWRGEVV
jgi:ribA/ribD-fused uncharacterized protein